MGQGALACWLLAWPRARVAMRNWKLKLRFADLSVNANGKNQSERCKDVAGKRPKRPSDFSQATKLVVDIPTGQVEDREPTRTSVRASKAFKNQVIALI
jgi:hypothetical protein